VSGDLNVAKLVSYYCVNDDYKFAYGAQVKFQVISCSIFLFGRQKVAHVVLEVASMKKKKGRVDFLKQTAAYLQYDNVKMTAITLYDIQQD
jgi:hypothetical protein